MLQIVLTKGLPASGKSTWAKEQVKNGKGQWKRINKDDLRAMLDISQWSKERERFVESVRDRIILEALAIHINVIIDDTNFAPKHEARMRELAGNRAEVIIKDFTHVPLEECIKRDLARPVSVGSKVIKDMYDKYLRPKVPAAPAWNGQLDACIICDLDGTLALFDGLRGPFEHEKCADDRLNTPVRDVLHVFKQSCHDHIILLSGREEKYRPQTEAFLKKHSVSYDKLIMRATDDMRNDGIIKRELYDEHIKDRYNVRFVLDDRDRVVDVWRRELGLPCFQVNYGDF